MSHRANYARCTFQQQLGPSGDALDVPWADFAGDSTDIVTFDVPTEAPTDPYVEMQVYDVGTFSHDIRVNGDPLSGFDVAPGEGWQYWMDTIAAPRLHEGENTIQFRRDRDTDDAFVVGTAIVHWKEPTE